MQLSLEAPTVLVCTRAIDFRRSIDGLVAFICAELAVDPRAGIFVFYNRARDKVKLLAWHKNGFVLLLKRLERGRFFNAAAVGDTLDITVQELSWLLAGFDFVSMSKFGELTYRDFR